MTILNDILRKFGITYSWLTPSRPKYSAGVANLLDIFDCYDPPSAEVAKALLQNRWPASVGVSFEDAVREATGLGFVETYDVSLKLTAAGLAALKK